MQGRAELERQVGAFLQDFIPQMERYTLEHYRENSNPAARNMVVAKLHEAAHGNYRDSLAAELFRWPAETVLDLSANLNPYGPPPALLKKATKMLPELARYPQIFSEDAALALAHYLHTETETLILGNGAADLIYRLLQLISYLLEEGDTLLFFEPGFSEYRQAAENIGLPYEVLNLRAEDDFQLTDDLLAEIRPEHRFVFLCNPNNPTGTVQTPERLARLQALQAERGNLLILDACFLDFLPREERRRLRFNALAHVETLTLYSFTKIMALPGLRLGYLQTADPELAEALQRLTPPWQVNALAQAVLPQMLAYLSSPAYERDVSALRESNRALQRQLQALGAKTWGEANYVYLHWPGRHDLQLALLEDEARIYIRSCANYPGLDWADYRIAVRTPDEMARLSAALERVAQLPPFNWTERNPGFSPEDLEIPRS